MSGQLPPYTVDRVGNVYDRATGAHVGQVSRGAGWIAYDTTDKMLGAFDTREDAYSATWRAQESAERA